MDCEIRNMLTINEMYQKTIIDLEGVIHAKDDVIKEHMKLISKLSAGNTMELSDLKMMLFTKQKDLVEEINKQKLALENLDKDHAREMEVKEAIVQNLRS